MLGLYIHIPFCDEVCYYCDFPKRIAKSNIKEKYIDSLLDEINFYRHLFPEVKSIYIGGGTPSSLNYELLEKLLCDLDLVVEEFTIECNPNDITDEFLNVLKRSNVNRISLGVQTFDDNHLKTIGRNHSKELAFNSISKIKEYGFNLNIDLIYNIPGQTIEDLSSELEIVESLNLDHISYYSLILEEKTVFDKLIKKDKLKVNEEDTDATMFNMIIHVLSNIGYNHYEISNYAKPGKESFHNKIYWNNQEYIGIGMSASGYLNGVRYHNSFLLNQYSDLVDDNGHSKVSETPITKNEKMFEHLMLGFRLLDGISIDKFNDLYNTDIFKEFEELNKLANDELIIIENGIIKLTKRGLFLNNEVLVRLI
ncbi:radical SAM family heme chaperone HemW [Mycoplasmatota bacterium WC44]